MNTDQLCPFCERKACWVDEDDIHHCTNCGIDWWFTDDDDPDIDFDGELGMST